MKPLGLYIHIPFCQRKCAYCDFVSYPNCEAEIDGYIENLIGEARLYEDALYSHSVDTVFIGGGTPSMLSAKQFVRLTQGLIASCSWAANEFTVEANPESLNEEKLSAYADCGVNRLSLGLQTHDDAILTRIGRRHTWDTFQQAFLTASKRIANINVDTIFGLPDQSMECYLETLQRVAVLGVKHVSSYALKLEAGTPLAAEYKGMDEDMDREMYHAGIEMMNNGGLKQYETSNFAVSGFECRHNLKYWTGAEYLGLGVSAHSMLRDGKSRRFGNIRSLEEYFLQIRDGRQPIAQQETLTDRDEREEYIMLRLRLKEGIVFSDYFERFGESFIEEYDKAIRFCAKSGLIVYSEKGIASTEKGFDLQNTLIGEFLNYL